MQLIADRSGYDLELGTIGENNTVDTTVSDIV